MNNPTKYALTLVVVGLSLLVFYFALKISVGSLAVREAPPGYAISVYEPPLPEKVREVQSSTQEIPRIERPWATYEDQVNGIRFSYPPAWNVRRESVVEERNEGEKVSVVYWMVSSSREAPMVWVDISRTPVTYQSLEEYKAVLDRPTPPTPPGAEEGLTGQHVTMPIETWGGMRVLPSHYQGEGGEHEYIFMLRDGYLYSFSEFSYANPRLMTDVARSVQFLR